MTREKIARRNMKNCAAPVELRPTIQYITSENKIGKKMSRGNALMNLPR